MYLNASVRQEVEERLGRKVPAPDDPAFDTLLDELYSNDPELAALLQGGVVFANTNDPREATIKVEQRASRRRGLRAALFMKRDAYTSDLLISKTKVSSWVLLALLLTLALAFWYNRATTASLAQVGAQTPYESEASSPTKSATTSTSPFGVSAPLEASGQDLVAKIGSVFGDIVPTPESASGVGVPTEELVEANRTQGVPLDVSLDPSVPRPAAPAPLASEPPESSLAHRRGAESVGVEAYRRPVAATGAVMHRPTPDASAVIFAAPPMDSSITTESRNGDHSSESAVIFAQNATTSAASALPSPLPAAPEPAEPLQSALASPVPFYEQPVGDLVLPESEPAAKRYAIGDALAASLETGVVLVEGQTAPVVARAEDGSVWQGQAQLNAVGRVEMVFTLVGNEGVTALAYDQNDTPGIKAVVRNEAPALAADLVGASLRGVTDYVAALGNQQTIVQNGESVVLESEVPPLEWLVGSSLAELFSPPETKRALVRVGELPTGTPFTLRVMGGNQ